MLLRSLTLENFKSYAHATVEFVPGTNVILGHNGAGKTTLLEAIGFALFDHRPPNMTLGDLVREGARWARVTVAFLSSLDRQEYQVVRQCGASNQYYVYDPREERKRAEGKADVLQFLHEHLGVDESIRLDDLFRNAVGVPQGTFTAAFLETPTHRQHIFNPLLRVEEYRQAFDRLLEPLNLLRKRQEAQLLAIRGLEARVERLEGLREEAARLIRSIQEQEEALKALEAELVRVGAQRAQAETLEDQVQEQEQAVERLRGEVASWQRQRDTAQRHLAEALEAQAMVEAHREGHRAYQAAQARQQELLRLDRERRKLQREQDQVAQELAAARERLAHLEEALEKAHAAQRRAEELAEPAAHQEALENALREAERQVERQAALRGEAERVAQELAAARERLAHLEEALARLPELTAQEAAQEARLQELEAALRTTQDERAQVQAELEALARQEAELEGLDTAQCPLCEQPLTPEHRAQLLARNRSRQAELQERLATLLERIAAGQQALETGRQELAGLRRVLRELPRPEEQRQAQERVAALRKRLETLQETLDGLTGSEKRVQEIQAELRELGDPRRERELAAAQAAQATALQQRLDAVRQEEAALHQQRTALEGLLQGYRHLDRDLEDVAQELARHREADDLYRRHLALAERVPEREQEVYRAQEALEQAQARLAAQEKALAQLVESFDPEHLAQLRAQEQELRERRQAAATRGEEHRARLAQVEQEIQELEQRAQELAHARERWARLQEQEELLAYLRNLLKEAGPYVTRALVEQISHGANQIFAEIMQDYSRELRWQEDYGIVLMVEGRERPFGQLSGGEQMSAALAVRLALLREMSDIQVAFFDEPTTNLDEVRRDALAQQILGIQGFHQLFVISHDDTFEQATDQVIRVEKVDGISQIRVEEG